MSTDTIIRTSSLLSLLVLSACGGGGESSSGVDTASANVVAACPAAPANSVADSGETRPGASAITAPPADAGTSPIAGDSTVPGETAAATISPTSFSGKGWYVDAACGSDLNAGTQAAPWKTLAKASTVALSAGDAILLKCGGTWRESLQIGGKATVLSGVTLGIYGDCTTATRPWISGADPIRGVTWTLSNQFGGKPVYVAGWTLPVSHLYWNNTPLTRARHPNYGGIGAEFNLVQQVKTATSFTLSAADVTLMATSDLSGATAHLRTDAWKTEAATVQSYSKADGTVTLAAATRGVVNAGEGYILEGHKALLDAPGEWFHDASSGTLYVYLPSGQSPDTGVLETVERSVGVSLRNTTDARVEYLQFDRQATRSLELIDAPRTLVSDVASHFSGQTGIYIDRLHLESGSEGTRIVRASVSGVALKGIEIFKSPGSFVESSTVRSTGIAGQPGAKGVGISISDSNNSVLLRNTVEKSASSAIELGRISGVSVVGNTLTQACMRFTDCGAIYAWGAPGGELRNTIRSNRITHMTPNVQGAVGGEPTLVAGIYFDIDSGKNDTTDNMISNVGVGLMMLGASNNRFASNHVWPVHSASIRIHSHDPLVDNVRGNVIEGNLLYGALSLKPSASSAATFNSNPVFVQRWIHSSNANAMFTGSNPNIVRNNTTGSVTSKSSLLWELQSGQDSTFLDRNQWATVSQGERQLQAFDVNLVLPTFTGGNLLLNGALASPAAPWTYWAAPGSADGSVTFGGCSGGCAVFTSGSPQDALSSGELNLSSTDGDSLYMLRFKAQSLTGTPVQATVRIARNGGDWSSLGLEKLVTVPADAETVSENLFVATATHQGRLSFFAPKSSTLRIREVSLQKVESYELLAPTNETVLVANQTSSPSVVDCAASGLRTCLAKHLDGMPVIWPLTIPANSAAPLIAADGKWLRTP